MVAQKIAYLFPNAVPLKDYEVRDNGSGAFIYYWNPAVGTQPTQQQLDAVTQGMLDTATLTSSYTRAKALLVADDDISKKDKAVLLVILDELNLHADKINSILTAIDGAATLAAMKTAIAAIADYPTRTVGQLRTSVQNKIDAGSANG